MIYLSGALPQFWARDHACPHNALHSPVLSLYPQLLFECIGSELPIVRLLIPPADKLSSIFKIPLI